jgi:hypothetical protein
MHTKWTANDDGEKGVWLPLPEWAQEFVDQIDNDTQSDFGWTGVTGRIALNALRRAAYALHRANQETRTEA